MWVETFRGLQVTQFAPLVKAVRERGGDGTLRGRPRSLSLSLAERVLLVAVYYRTNLTGRRLGPLFGVSSSMVCRVIQRLGPPLAIEPVSRPADAADRLWIVGGTLVPARDRRVGASSRHHRFSANVRLIVGRSGPAGHCEGVTMLGDGAYLNAGMAVQPQTPRTAAAERRGRGQRGAPQGPRPRGAGDRPDEELQDPARLLPAGRRSPSRGPGCRPHAQPRSRVMSRHSLARCRLPSLSLG